MSIPLATLVRFQDGFIAARSPFASGGAPAARAAPLLLELDRDGSIVAAVDTITSLGDATLTSIANSGHLAAGDSLFFFAPLTRDEVRAFDARGRPRWTATRALAWPRPPRFTPGSGGPGGLDYRPVNLALTTHAGMVYSLAYADSTGETMRLDAFDELTGVLARSATLPTSTMLISLDDDGALWHAPADTLAVIGAPAGTVIVDFALPTFRGDTLRLGAYRGKVVLLNIWASWCGPCRDEFPLMAELSRDLPPEDFAVVAVSDDVRESDARRFLDEFSPPFATAWARGELAGMLTYNGLPFTVLLDREGRVVKRYIGFGGRDQFERLRGDIARAIMETTRAGQIAPPR
jgi:thiol-disulfide isomerase/thioredoxin